MKIHPVKLKPHTRCWAVMEGVMDAGCQPGRHGAEHT